MVEALIDLDLAPPPAPARRPRPRWIKRLRAPFAIAVVLATTVILGGAAAPGPPRFTGPFLIPGATSDDFVLLDDGVLVRAGAWQEVRSYGLDGVLRWAAPPPVRFFMPIGALGDLMLVSSPPPGETAALDRRTGALRWRADGSLFAAAGETVVLSFGGSAQEFDRGVRVLAGVGAADGRVRWRADVTPTPSQRQVAIFGARFSGDWRRSGMGIIDADGTGRILDLATGQWRAISETPVASDEEGRYGFTVDDLVVVFSGRPIGPGKIRVYGPDGGAPLWTADTRGLNAALCGQWICVPDGARTRVLDLRTGIEQRSVDWPRVISGGGDGLLGYDSQGAIEATRVAAIDARTGQILRAYEGWDVVLANFTDWVPIVRRASGLRWEIAALAVAEGLAYPMDLFEPAGERACQATETHVACAVRSGDVLVWGYRPAR